jgi:hypothetical protein
MGCNTTQSGDSLTFWRNMSPPFSGSNSKQNMKSAEVGTKLPQKCQALSEPLMLKSQRLYSSKNYLLQGLVFHTYTRKHTSNVILLDQNLTTMSCYFATKGTNMITALFAHRIEESCWKAWPLLANLKALHPDKNCLYIWPQLHSYNWSPKITQ